MGKAVNGGSINFYDLDEGRSPIITVDRKKRSIKREGEIAWSDIEALIAECFPSGLYPGSSYLYVETMEIRPKPEPVPSGGNVPTFTGAFVTINYAPDEQKQNQGEDGQPLITRRYGIGGEFMTLPSTSLVWASDNARVNQEFVNATKIIPLIEHSITWHQANSIPWTAIRNNLGRVNENAFAADNLYFPNVGAETLLFMGADINATFDTSGQLKYTLEYRFQEKSFQGTGFDGNLANVHWNYFYRSTNRPHWGRLIDQDGKSVYETSSTMTDLFA